MNKLLLLDIDRTLVHSLPTYLVKDEFKTHFNSIIYDEYTLLNAIGYKDTVTKEIPLQSGSVLIITGDTYYKLKSCAGFGELNLIRIGCYRNKPYRCDDDE